MNGLREFPCNTDLVKLAMEAPVAKTVKRDVGRITTGSEFVTTSRKKELASVWKEVGEPDCVEMEGAGVAQICHAFSVPFLLLRSLSDNLEGDASDDFNAFAQQVAEHLYPIVEHILKNIK